jgi:hypothetical protein
MVCGMMLPNLYGANLHDFTDDSDPAPVKTITKGTGDAAQSSRTLRYACWWGHGQKVPNLLLSSMEEGIMC